MRPRAAAALARAKINLCLHVTGRRSDGYHLLDSLVVFAEVGDRVEVEPADRLSLTLAGPFGQDLPADGNNLVLRAAAMMPGAPAGLLLEKNLPVTSGIGGGSADAAATLLALREMSGAPLPSEAEVLSLGADVPVCLSGRPTRMRGIGEVLDPVPELPAMWCVLVNPGVSCSTPEVFGVLDQRMNPGLPALPEGFADFEVFMEWLRTTRNDLEAPAIALRPVIGEVLGAVEATQGCALARMSGSGATVFGVFEAESAALAAATQVRAQAPGWWVAAAPLAK